MRVRINFTDYGQYVNWKNVVYMMDTQDDEGKRVIRIAYEIANPRDSDSPPYREQDYALEGIREIHIIPDPEEEGI
jgi:hypothetical protein